MVGSGVTGAEFVNAYTELGVQVTVVASRDRVLPYEDADAALVLEESFAERGVRLIKNARAASVARTDTGVLVTMTDGRTVERMRYYASGTPQAPLTKEQVEEKFFSCAERAVDKSTATKLFAFLNRLDEQPSLAGLWTLLNRA